MNETPDNRRPAEERAVLAQDQQEIPDRLGKVDVFAGHQPDGIAMTGEEDPFAEVDTGTFADTVAEFAASEKRQGTGS